MKHFAALLSESESDSDKQAASQVFKMLLPKFFEDDCSVMNPDMIELYAKHLGRMKDWADLISLKRRLIKEWIAEKKRDHRLRRAYLEILCTQIIQGDKYRLQETIDQLCNDCGGNPYSYEEYEACEQLKAAQDNADPDQVIIILKMSIFGFIESEVAKALKLWAINEPRVEKAVPTNKEKAIAEPVKKSK